MINKIKSITKSRKQLMLLPLMLFAGGMLQAQVAAPDTVYVSFTNSAVLDAMTYGTAKDAYVTARAFNLESFTFTWAPVGGPHALMVGYQNQFAGGKAAKDILAFDGVPTVPAGGKIALNETALTGAFTCYSAPGVERTNVIYKVSKDEAVTTARTFSVTKASLVIAAKSKTIKYGDPLPTYTTAADFTVAGLLNGDVAETVLGTGATLPDVSFDTTPKDVNSYSTKLSGGSTANYTFATVDGGLTNDGVPGGILTIEKAALTVTLPAKERKYDDPNLVELPVSELSVDNLKHGETLAALLSPTTELTLAHIATDVAPKSDVNTYSYSLAGADKTVFETALKNYDVTYTGGKYEVKKDEMTIIIYKADEEVNDLFVMHKIYGEPNPAVYFKLKKRVSGEEKDLILSSTSKLQSFISAVSNPGFTVSPKFNTYDENGKVMDEKTDACKKDQTYPVKVDNKAEIKSTNYEFTIVDGTFVIDQRPLKMEKVVVDRIYGDTKQDTTWMFEATGNKRGLATFDSGYKTSTNAKAFYLIDVMPLLKISKQAADSTLNAGSYTETVLLNLETAGAKDRNYALEFALVPSGKPAKNENIRLEVAKADLTITLKTVRRPYGSEIPDFNDELIQREFIAYQGFKLDESANNLDSTATVAVGNRIKNLRIEGVDALPKPLPVGSYELLGVQDINNENTNYKITIKGRAYYDVYPATDYVLDWQPLNTDLIVGDLIRLDGVVKKGINVVASGSEIDYTSSSPDSIQIEKVGEYCYLRALKYTGDKEITITARYHGHTGYEEVISTTTYRVVKLKNEADFNVKLSNMNFVYDGTKKEAEVEVTDLDGRVQPSYVLYNGDTDIPVTAGTYNVSIYTKQAAGGSDLFIRKETMRIKKREVLVKPVAVSQVYGKKVPESFGYMVSGFLGSDGFKINKVPQVKVLGNVTGAGEYILFAEGGDPGDNYTMVGDTALLAIDKALLTISADTVRTTYGSDLPVFVPKYHGLVTGETADDLNFIYKVVKKSSSVDAGIYDLTFDYLDTKEPNYVVTLLPGKLYIGKADPQLKWTVAKTTIAGGDSIQLYAEMLSPEKISYKMQYDTIAKIKANEEGVLITGQHKGVSKLYLSVPEGKNYLAKNDSVTFNVSSDMSSVSNEKITLEGVSLYPTWIENQTTITSPVPVKMLLVVNYSGQIVYSVSSPENVVSLGRLANGPYLVQLVLATGETKTIRIVKK